MDTREAFRKRRSVRKFDANPVSDADIQEILLAASQAPTARNIQPWEFIVIKDKTRLEEIGRLTQPNGALVAGAAACVAVVCQQTKYYLEDGCAATSYALLRAASLGLGGCWVAGDKKEYADAVKRLLAVPRDYKLVSLIALGHPAETPSPGKKELNGMVHNERF